MEWNGSPAGVEYFFRPRSIEGWQIPAVGMERKGHGNRTDNDTTETHKRVQPPITTPLADVEQLNAVCSHAEDVPS
jgi:hypothetical protein